MFRALHELLIALMIIGAVSGAYADCGVAPPPTCSPVGTFDPANPAASGYSLVFSDTFTNSSTIDMADTGNAGFHWYRRQFFGYPTEAAANIVTSSGHLVLAGNNHAGYEIATAAPNANTQGWIGNVFRGGAFFEASIAFDGPAVVAGGYNGFPAFWSMAVEHMANKGASQVAGKPAGYENFTEDDFFEYSSSGDPSHAYTWGIHNWYQYASTPACTAGYRAGANQYCDIVNLNAGTAYNNAFVHKPGGVTITWNPTTFHTIGHLWVPGNAANSNLGYRQAFIDNLAAEAGAGTGAFAPLGKVGWTHTLPINVDTLQNPGLCSGTCGGSPQAFSIQDEQGLVVILGSGPSQPYHINAVRIWQIPGCGTIAH